MPMNCEEKAMKAQLEADHGVAIKRVRVTHEGGRTRIRVELREPVEVRPDHGGTVRRGVLHVSVN